MFFLFFLPFFSYNRCIPIKSDRSQNPIFHLQSSYVAFLPTLLLIQRIFSPHLRFRIIFRRNGYNLSVSATTIEDAKTRFIEKLKYAGKDTASSVPRTFLKFAKYWMENFHKRKVVPETYAYSQRIFKAYIATAFPDVEIRKITPLMAQKVLDALDQIARTKEGVYGLLNQIFRAAINHGILQVNPMMQVVYKTHDRTHGTALTVKEEKKLLAAFQGTPLQSIFALLLYTGLRPGELVTHSVKDRFIVAQNSKRKGGKIEYKKIPITPMLAPYVADLPENLPAYKTLCAKFKKVLPSHKFYDLRTTFQTRCTECGICDAAIGEFMGNSIGKLKDTYTDLSDDFLFNEGQKLKY